VAENIYTYTISVGKLERREITLKILGVKMKDNIKVSLLAVEYTDVD
jgi:hypothetical protein